MSLTTMPDPLRPLPVVGLLGNGIGRGGGGLGIEVMIVLVGVGVVVTTMEDDGVIRFDGVVAWPLSLAEGVNVHEPMGQSGLP